MKRCLACKKTKKVEDFNKRASTKDGLQTYCRQCQSKKGTRYMRSLRKQEWFLEEERAYNRERYLREREQKIARSVRDRMQRRRRRRGPKKGS